MAIKYDHRLVVMSYQLKTIQLAIQLKIASEPFMEHYSEQLFFINTQLQSFYMAFRNAQYARHHQNDMRFTVYLTRTLTETLKDIVNSDTTALLHISAETQEKLRGLIAHYHQELDALLCHTTQSAGAREEIITDDEYRHLLSADPQ